MTLWDSNSGEILNQFSNIDSVDELISSRTLTAADNGTFLPNGVVFWGSLIPDSTLMILGLGNETDEVNIWDWSTGEKVQTLLGIDMIEPNGQAFAGPDGESVVAVSRLGGPDTEVDGVRAGFQIVAWDIDNGEQIYRIEGARGERMFTAASVTPDNQIAVIGVTLVDEQNQRLGSRVLIIDLGTDEILREAAQAELAGNIERAFVKDVTINFAGDQAFVIYGNGRQESTGIFLSLPSGEVEATMPLDPWINYAKFSPDGTQIAVVGGEFATFFTLYDTTTGELIRHLGSANEGHSDHVSDRSIAFTPDGKRFVSADGGGNLFLWDVETGDLTERLLGYRGDRFFTLQMSPDGQTVITGNQGTLHFWDISQIGAAQVFEEHRDAVEILHLTLSPDGTKAVSTAIESPNEAILWDTSTFEIIHRLPGVYKTAEFLPDGQSVILGGVVDFIDWESRLVHWDIESGEVIGEKNTGVFDPLWDLDVSPDDNSLLFVTGTPDIYLYDLETLTEMKRFTVGGDEILRSVAFSPDGHAALVGSFFGSAISIDLETDEETQERYVQGGIIWNIVFSEDGERFVVASGDNTLILWDVASGEVIRTFIGHTDAVTKVAFTPDESQLLSTSADGTLILWDVASGEALRTFNEHTAWINVVALSPDGQLAYSAGNDGQVIVRPIVEIPLDELLDTIAENRVLRDFSCEEREQFRILPLCGADGVVPED